jgi:hypothetical protein
MANAAEAALDRFYSPAAPRRLWVGLAILAVWAALVVAQIARHVLWRDEVRALSFAENGDTILDMLKGLHGEGHPALWYLMLRAAYDVVGRVEVLPGLAFLTALAAVALLIFRAPFSRTLTLALVASHVFLFEYSVMARNYGISALLLFAIADSYRARRDRGIWLGLLLFGLANTNVVAAIMVGAFLLFWMFDVLGETGLRWSSPARSFLVNSLIAVFGIVVCGLTVMPTFNDAAVRDWSHGSSAAAAAGLALIDPAGTSLGALTFALPSALGSALLIGCAIGLLPNRAACVGALAGLLVAAVFFAVGSQGAYRHAGVWLMFCVALYWIVWKDLLSAPSGSGIASALRLARWALPALLLLQAFADVKDVPAALLGPVESRAADLAAFVAAHKELADAVIVAEPDYLVETLPYYLPNRTYLLREHKFGAVDRYSKSSRLDLDLGEIRKVCEDLRRSMGAPVLVLLAHRLDQIQPGTRYHEGYDWSFEASAEQIEQFLAATTLLDRFGAAATDEAFDVYQLK